MPQFSQRASQLTSSLIREILAATQQPGVISFAGGLPATDLLPKLNWSSVPFDTEQYGMSEGEPALREAIARDAQKLGIRKIEANEKGGMMEFAPKNCVNPAWLIGLLQKQPRAYRLDGPDRLKFFVDLSERKNRMEWVRHFMQQLTDNAMV